MKKFLLFLFLLSLTKVVNAYPNFIGFGYNSCSSCHYNPFGNGPLTDYGRALSATEVASRMIFDKSKSEDEIGKQSGFLYREPFNSWFRPSIDYRGLRLKRGLGKEGSETKYYTMQADFNGTIKINGSDKYFVTATYGYSPKPESKKEEDIPEYRSREHYVGIRPSSTWGVYIGMMDKVYGIRVPDHIAFSRSTTRLGQNDQTHGVLFHLNQNDFEIGLHPFVGNLSVDADERQKGFSTKVEYSFTNKVKPGFSFLQSKSDYIKLTNASLHYKQGLSKGSSFMLELGQSQKEDLVSNEQTKSQFGFMQNHFNISRGFFAFTTLEYLKPSQDSDRKIYRVGPGIQYFPMQGIEMRLDLYNTKVLSSTLATSDSWDLAGQVHIWL